MEYEKKPNDHLKHRLRAALDGHEAAGGFGPDAIAQERGLTPRARDEGLHPADDREPADPRSRESEGPTEGPGVAADPDEAKAAGAQARGIEAEQPRLRDESVSERYQAVLQTYLQANAQRIERTENRLETLIENQQAALGEMNAQRLGFFASSANKPEWSPGFGAAQDRLQVLRGRFSRLEEIKEHAEELSEEEMREREPELARAWDEARRSQRNTQERQHQDKQTTRHTGLDREREIGGE